MRPSSSPPNACRRSPVNTALKVLLDKRQEDKSELENDVVINVKELIFPYMNKLKRTDLDDQQRALLNIVESNPCIRKIYSRCTSSIGFSTMVQNFSISQLR